MLLPLCPPGPTWTLAASSPTPDSGKSSSSLASGSWADRRGSSRRSVTACPVLSCPVLSLPLPPRQVQDLGRNLTASQKQLLCLARCLLAEPKVVVLDEVSYSSGQFDYNME